MKWQSVPGGHHCFELVRSRGRGRKRQILLRIRRSWDDPDRWRLSGLLAPLGSLKASSSEKAKELALGLANDVLDDYEKIRKELKSLEG